MLTGGILFALLDLAVAGGIVFFFKRKPAREPRRSQSRF